MNLEQYMDRLQEKYKKPYIQIPNRLIKEMSEDFDKHGAKGYLAYGFSFLITNAFLYKYVHYVDYDNCEYLTISDIKTMLKYNPKNQSLNKISKSRDGVLEMESYIESTTDIPVSYSYVKQHDRKIDIRNIERLSEVPDYMRYRLQDEILTSPRFHANIPEFMVDYPKRYGTLNDYKDTFTLTYSEFKYFIFNDNFEIRDFLLYCYFKSISDKSRECSVSAERIRKDTGLSHVTSKKISEKLESFGVISITESKNINRFQKRPKTYTITGKYQ